LEKRGIIPMEEHEAFISYLKLMQTRSVYVWALTPFTHFVMFIGSFVVLRYES